jgi:hypothetical protein
MVVRLMAVIPKANRLRPHKEKTKASAVKNETSTNNVNGAAKHQIDESASPRQVPINSCR